MVIICFFKSIFYAQKIDLLMENNRYSHCEHKMDGLLTRLENSFEKGSQTNVKKSVIYENCKMFNDCLQNISSKKKDELVEFVDALIDYKERDNKNYKNIIIEKSVLNLSDEQYLFVTSDHNIHHRIVASAGSGKTTSMCVRVKYLIDNFVSPKKILMLTFNVDACDAMRNKISAIFGFQINVEIRTIDSFCGHIKKKYDTEETKTKYTSLTENSINGEYIMKKYGKIIAQSYSYVFFDEFQDVDQHQFNILKIFADSGCYLTIIGDDQQNIYQWRGSNNYYMINFDQILTTPTKTLTLTTNYRSKKNIVDAANKCLSFNKNKIEKLMIANNENVGKIKLIVHNTQEEMLEELLNKICSLVVNENYKYHDIAILSRNKHHLKLCEELLQKNFVPFCALLSENIGSKQTILQDKVAIATIYKSKGLEWKSVFILGISDDQFPSHMNNNIINIEEDRRLFYVAITRAKENVNFYTYKQESPFSRFIGEIKEHVEQHNVKKGNLNNFDDKNDNNIEKMTYKTDDVVQLFKGIHIKELRTKNLLLDDFMTEQLFDVQLRVNVQILENFFESDFSIFCSKIIVRDIMKENKQKIKDHPTESIVEGHDLTPQQAEIYYKYNINDLMVEHDYDCNKVINILKKIADECEFDSIVHICSKCDPFKESRRCNSYPANVLTSIKKSYISYTDEKLISNDILEEIYFVSLCTKFIDGRRRLVHRNIYNMITLDFEPIHTRINKYVEHMKGKKCTCNIPLQQKINTPRKFYLESYVDIFDETNNMMINLEYSNEDMNVNWILKLIIQYYMMQTTTYFDKEREMKYCIFNILTGKMFTGTFKKDYDMLSFMGYVKQLVNDDKTGVRCDKEITIEYLRSIKCEDNSIKEDPNVEEKFLKDCVHKKKENHEHTDLEKKYHYISIDVETGTWGIISEIIQIAYVIYDENFNELKKVNKFIKNRNVEKRAHDVHGISAEYLEKHGKEFCEVFEEVISDMEICKHVIGHNINSDIGHITSNVKKYMNINLDIFDNLDIHDTMKIGKAKYETFVDKNGRKKYPTLSELYFKIFGKNMKNAHDALADCLITAECYKEMTKIIN
jgi:DNA polymerase III epsilon subunit-like protein